VVAADAAMIARVFHILNWTATELERTLQRLLREGQVRLVEAPGWPRPRFIPVDVLDTLHL